MINIYTMGVYGYDEASFFDALVRENIELFIDIRRRRGVRGKLYKFVNSKYLQKKLQDLKIEYLHYIDLAPPIYVREKQKNIDSLMKIKKRKREKLSKEFIDAYKDACLKSDNIDDLIKRLEKFNKNVVLFCVERNPEACHRSIVTDYIKKHFRNINIYHIQ